MHDDIKTRITARITLEDRGHDSPCWVSDRAADGKGYTQIWFMGRMRMTHRVAYEAFVGPIPEGKQLDHLCRVRACCRPEHLEPVTGRENTLRGQTVAAAKAAQTHCIRGHELSGDNVYTRDLPRRERVCLTCRRDRDARRRLHKTSARKS